MDFSDLFMVVIVYKVISAGRTDTIFDNAVIFSFLSCSVFAEYSGIDILIYSLQE